MNDSGNCQNCNYGTARNGHDLKNLKSSFLKAVPESSSRNCGNDGGGGGVGGGGTS